jgi:hypothetical protein
MEVHMPDGQNHTLEARESGLANFTVKGEERDGKCTHVTVTIFWRCAQESVLSAAAGFWASI